MEIGTNLLITIDDLRWAGLFPNSTNRVKLILILILVQ